MPFVPLKQITVRFVLSAKNKREDMKPSQCGYGKRVTVLRVIFVRMRHWRNHIECYWKNINWMLPTNLFIIGSKSMIAIQYIAKL